MSRPGTEHAGLRGIAERFGSLAAAHGFREILQAVFLIVLARHQMITYGQFMFALGVGQILLMLAEFGLNQHVICRLARTPECESRIARQVLLAKALLLSLGGSAAFVLVVLQHDELTLRTVVLLLAAGVGLEALTSTYYTLGQWRGRQTVEGRVRAVAAAAGFGYGLAALAAGWSPILLALFKPIESLVGLAGAHWLLRPTRTGARSDPGLSIGNILRGGLPFALAELAATGYNKANLLFLQRSGGPAAVAQYSATWQVVDGVTTFVCGLLLGRTLFPLLARLLATDLDAARRLAHDTARWLLLPTTILVYGLIVESDRIIPLIYGPSYGDAVWMQRWLALGIVLGIYHNLAVYIMMSLGRLRLLVALLTGGLLLNLILCAAWIPRHPLGGSVAAILLTKIATAAGTLGFVQRRLGIFRLRPVAEFLASLLACALLFLATQPHLPRILCEAAALIPLLLLGLRWRRESTGREAPA